jgi:hypothetical protein
MPSNRELSEEILKINPAAVVDGLNNVALTGLLSLLKSAPATEPALSNDPVVFDPEKEAAKTADDAEAKRTAKLKAESEEAAKKQVAANAAEEAARNGNATHKVADGKSVICLRGVVPDFTGNDQVSVLDFGQGKADLDRLVADGVLVKL